ncbi:hypothetical protein DUNSADRAFT_11615 [Dunaliella salina]|uniref:Uncharacterized protein n=1 Tax=Dunaliella salina TaxID=3046 RepID=A0ABQ7GCY9_DUNSA|nr:hypothetical protein DUNSADRAFT_11615 [Dunaliella salina]|eukprot:KAF5832478.1 hypothetical protein DUNSADRAFT_11615 [Dunaliella salina]
MFPESDLKRPWQLSLNFESNLLGWPLDCRWFLYRADTQARSHDWIVDLSLNVLQAAWLISFASFLPFRSVYMSLRGMAPHTSTPLNALKPVSMMK